MWETGVQGLWQGSCRWSSVRPQIRQLLGFRTSARCTVSVPLSAFSRGFRILGRVPSLKVKDSPGPYEITLSVDPNMGGFIRFNLVQEW